MNLLVTESIRLTEIERSDKDALVEYLNDREVYERTLRIPFPYTSENADFWFSLVEQSTKRNGQTANWAIRDEAGKLIGSVGLEGPGFDNSHRAEIGYWLARPFWGRGIATGAVKVVCRHAFDQIGLQKITAHTFSFNAASARVLEKSGFEQEGYLKRHFIKDGKPIDAQLFALLK